MRRPTPNTPTPTRSLPRTPPTPAVSYGDLPGPTGGILTCRLRRSHPTPLPHPSAGSDPAVRRWRDVDRRKGAPTPPRSRCLLGLTLRRRSPATSRWRYHPAGSNPPQVRSPPTCAGNSPWRPWPNSTPAAPRTVWLYTGGNSLQMRVSKQKIGRKGTYLGGGGMSDAIGVSIDRGCCEVGGLSVRGC